MKKYLALSIIISSAVIGYSASGEESVRPNVLMISIDDLNDYVSILQKYPGIKTPNFDRLAKRGVNFTRAYCAAPLCNPSRVALVTGMAPHQTGVYQLGDLLSRSAPAMAAVALEEQFKRHGYDTYLTGKYYHAGEDHWWPKARLDAMWTERKAPFSDHGPKDGPNTVMGRGMFSIGPAPGGFESMPDFAILKNTKGWLAQKHDKPFFMVQGIAKPHVTFVVPKQFFDLYPLHSVVLPEDPEGDWSDIPPSVLSNFLGKGAFGDFEKLQKTKDGWREVMQAYMASISFCDWVLGQVLDYLDASPYAKNTIVVLWSDNGYHLGEKEHFGKRVLWSQSSRIPFMISLPGMATAGKSCAAPVNLLDIYPTLNELCHLTQAVPQKLAGHSIVPLLKNPDQAWSHLSLTSHDVGNAAVSDARYHYIRYADGAEELYDNEKDPREFTNLAQNPECKAIIKRLSAELPASWRPTAKGGGKKGGID